MHLRLIWQKRRDTLASVFKDKRIEGFYSWSSHVPKVPEGVFWAGQGETLGCIWNPDIKKIDETETPAMKLGVFSHIPGQSCNKHWWNRSVLEPLRSTGFETAAPLCGASGLRFRWQASSILTGHAIASVSETHSYDEPVSEMLPRMHSSFTRAL
jgi:hypothetical protein